MRRALLWIVLLTAYGLFLFVRVGLLWEQEAKDTLLEYQGQQVTAIGTVSADPDLRATSDHLNIAVATINGERARGVLLAIVARQADVAYGDTVTVSGKVEQPQAFETDTGRTFDYTDYLRVQGVSAMMSPATVVDVTAG
ncbi:MAG TPA: DUF4131 domain-containing protein, partial [Candidatus Paceibacterota bacterium]|nr:DUF4131 domain-containing protein [Candidatus Paceibacterota bacterium]